MDPKKTEPEGHAVGDWLLLRYGNGTQVALIEGETPHGRRWRIRRLQGYNEAHGGRWTLRTTYIGKTDPRIRGEYLRRAGHPSPPDPKACRARIHWKKAVQQVDRARWERRWRRERERFSETVAGCTCPESLRGTMHAHVRDCANRPAWDVIVRALLDQSEAEAVYPAEVPDPR